MKNIFLAIAIILFALNTNAQSVAINNDGTTAHASAILDLKSTNQGVLVPRMTASQRGLIASPATGLMVYQTDAPAGFYFYNGTAWTSLNGTAGTNGQGVPTGGTANQVLAKVNATDFNTQWVTPTPGNATVDLVVSKTTATQTPVNAQGSNTGDIITFDNVIKSPTIGSYSAVTNTYTVGTSGYYYIQVRSVSVDAATASNTVGHWFKVEIDPVGSTTASFVNDRDIYGVYPVISGINFPSGLKGRGELQGVVFLNAGDTFVIKGLTGNSSATNAIKNDGSCKLTVVKLN
jgi:hypothetical protein